MKIVFLSAGQKYALKFEDERKNKEKELSEQIRETITSETEEVKSHINLQKELPDNFKPEYVKCVENAEKENDPANVSQ